MEKLRFQKANIIDRLIASVALALVPVAVMVTYFGMIGGWGVERLLQLLVFSVIWVLSLRKDLLTSSMRASVIVLFLLAAALSEVYRSGLMSATFPMLAVLPIVGTVIGGVRLGLAGIGLISLAMVVIGWDTVISERMPLGMIPEAHFAPEEWVVRIVNIAIAAGIGVYVTGSLYRFYQT